MWNWLEVKSRMAGRKTARPHRLRANFAKIMGVAKVGNPLDASRIRVVRRLIVDQ